MYHTLTIYWRVPNANPLIVSFGLASERDSCLKDIEKAMLKPGTIYKASFKNSEFVLRADDVMYATS